MIPNRLERIVVHSLRDICCGLSRPSPTAYFSVRHQTKVMTEYDLHSSYDARPSACSVRRICCTKVCVGHESAALGSDGVGATWCVGLGDSGRWAFCFFSLPWRFCFW